MFVLLRQPTHRRGQQQKMVTMAMQGTQPPMVAAAVVAVVAAAVTLVVAAIREVPEATTEQALLALTAQTVLLH